MYILPLPCLSLAFILSSPLSPLCLVKEVKKVEANDKGDGDNSIKKVQFWRQDEDMRQYKDDETRQDNDEAQEEGRGKIRKEDKARHEKTKQDKTTGNKTKLTRQK